jgi:hypothetical protein
VGDGVTDWGDFNGERGLQSCLEFIRDNQLDIPDRVKIIVKHRRGPSVGGFTHIINTPILISGTALEIEGLASSDFSATAEEPLSSRGLVKVSVQVAAFAIGLQLTGRSSLKMSNIEITEPATESNMILVDGPVDLKNCVIKGYAGDSIDAYALTCESSGSNIDACHLAGVVNFGGGELDAEAFQMLGGCVQGTFFDRSLLRLRNTITTVGSTFLEVAAFVAMGVEFANCEFRGRVSPSTPNLFGMLDARGASACTFKNCVLTHSSDENGVFLGDLATSDPFVLSNEHITIEDNLFYLGGDNTHLNGAGVGGVFGTGHHIFGSVTGLTSTIEQMDSIRIEHNTFRGIISTGSPDAHAILAFSPLNWQVNKNRFIGWGTALTATRSNRLVALIDAGVVAAPGRSVHFSKNFIGHWSDDALDFEGTLFTDIDNLWVTENEFDKNPRGATVTGDVVARACIIDGCRRANVNDNVFIKWDSSVNPLVNNLNLVLDGSVIGLQCNNNQFVDFSGAAIFGPVSATIDAGHFDGNRFNATGPFFAAIDFTTASTLNNNYTSNSWNLVAPGPFTAIHLGGDLYFVLVGNQFDGGNIVHATLAGAPGATEVGYGAAAPKLNQVLAFL